MKTIYMNKNLDYNLHTRDPLLTVMSLEDLAVIGSHIPRQTMRRVVRHADGADAEQRMVASPRLTALWYWVVIYERWANGGNPQWSLIRLEDLRTYEDRHTEANTRDVCARWMVREAPAALVGRLLTLCDLMGYTDAKDRIVKAAARALSENLKIGGTDHNLSP